MSDPVKVRAKAPNKAKRMENRHKIIISAEKIIQIVPRLQPMRKRAFDSLLRVCKERRITAVKKRTAARAVMVYEASKRRLSLITMSSSSLITESGSSG